MLLSMSLIACEQGVEVEGLDPQMAAVLAALKESQAGKIMREGAQGSQKEEADRRTIGRGRGDDDGEARKNREPSEEGPIDPVRGPDDPPDGPSADGCTELDAFFANEVFNPYLKDNCRGCHNSQNPTVPYYYLPDAGVIDLSDPTDPAYANTVANVVHDLDALKVRATTYLTDSNGNYTSLLLAKPLGNHPGGHPITISDPGFITALTELNNRLASGEAYGDPCEDDDGTPVYELELEDRGTTINKAALNLAGRPASDDEMFYANACLCSGHGNHDHNLGNGVCNPATCVMQKDAIRAALDTIMDEPSFLERVKEVYNDLLLTDRYGTAMGGSNAALGAMEFADFPSDNVRFYNQSPSHSLYGAAQGTVNDSVAQIPLNLIAQIVDEERPFTNVLTADTMVMNAYAASAYGLSVGPVRTHQGMGLTPVNGYWADNPEDLRSISTVYSGEVVNGSGTVLSPSQPMPIVGVLNTFPILRRFPTSSVNKNRHRAYFFYKNWLDFNILTEVPESLAPSSGLPANPTMNAPACNQCHTGAGLDAVAGLYQDWDSRGQYRPIDWDVNGNMVDPAFPRLDIDSNGVESIVLEPYDEFSGLTPLQWLGEQAANDRRFARATVALWFKELTGAAPVKGNSPIYARQHDDIEALVDGFITSSYNLKALIKEIVVSDYFRAIGVQGLDSTTDYLVMDYGATFRYGPEILDRKIASVMGEAWMASSSSRALTHKSYYRLIYGGINSSSVIERSSQNSALTVNTALRMAQEMACAVVAEDFDLPDGSRRFFNDIDLSQVPGAGGMGVGDNMAIRAAISDLFDIVLQRLEADLGDEVGYAFDLLLDTHDELSGTQVQQLPGACQAPSITQDNNYMVRSWSAVLAYLMADYFFTHQP